MKTFFHLVQTESQTSFSTNQNNSVVLNLKVAKYVLT